jgi:hypothetical protein
VNIELSQLTGTVKIHPKNLSSVSHEKFIIIV